MATLKARVDKLETAVGGKGWHLLEVKIEDGELLQDAVDRAAEKAGIPPKAVGMAHLYGPNLKKNLSAQGVELEGVFGHVRLNGYRGSIRDLIGFVPHEEWLRQRAEKCKEQGDILRSWRAKKGYSQSEAAKELELRDWFYSALEEGREDIPERVKAMVGIDVAKNNY